MTDSSKIIRFCEESEVGPFTKKLISLINLVMRRQGEAMANKRIFYPTISVNLKPNTFGKVPPYNLGIKDMNALKIGDRVKVIENDEGFAKDTLEPNDFKAYRDSIGREYEVTGVVNLKDKVAIAVSNTRFLYPACIFEKIGEVEQKDKKCTCELSLIMSQGCCCGGK